MRPTMFRWGCPILCSLTCMLLAGSADAQPLTVMVSPTRVASDGSSVISGTAAGQPPGASVQLYSSPYPYRASPLAASTTIGAGGEFSFSVAPDRNTRYQVRLPATYATAQVSVSVVPRTLIKVRALPLGRAGVTIVLFHPSDLSWGGATVSWSFASAAAAGFSAAPSTRTIAVSPHVAVLRTAIALPAGRFRFRACLRAPGVAALADATRVRGCRGRGYEGGGTLPVGFPAPAAIARAAAYISARGGREAFAVVDSEGRESGYNMDWRFTTASVVKAMLLTAYLRRLDERGQHYIDPYSNSFLYPMIHVSDNGAATTCWSIVGDVGLYDVARLAGMRDFSVAGYWLTAQITPADQAHFFFIMNSLIPKEFVSYAQFLLSTIIGWQTWGIAPVARPMGYEVFFKDGSEPTALGQLVHQVARLQGHGRMFSIAVMTDGDPSMLYGEQTIAGVAQALLY